MDKSLDKFKNIPEAFFALAESNPDTKLYQQALTSAADQVKKREIYSRTYQEVKGRILKLSHYLGSLGVGSGAHVAILSSTRPEWIEADLAILSLGGISVSIYQTLPYEDVGFILFDSESEIVFVENEEQVQKLTKLLEGPIDIPEIEGGSASKESISIKKIISFEEVAESEKVITYQTILETEAKSETYFLDNLNRSDLASLVYTSGTTGPPKGVMQTHGNHLANCRQAVVSTLLVPEARIMLFLPLAHSFARLMAYLGLLTDAFLCFPAIANPKSSKLNPISLSKDIREAKAHCIPMVPRLFEKMQAGVLAKAHSAGFPARLLSLSLWAAMRTYQDNQDGKKPGILARIVYQGTGSIRGKITEQLFGSDFKYGISGGAKLSPQVAHFFASLGIPILEGYGLTETCVATNCNRIDKNKIGTVGPVLDTDIEMKLASDGEILFRGPNIALGYYKREQATKKAWDSEGWFHTGDLGEIDQDGYLSIVGRKKEILVSSYGKNIAPGELESLIASSPLVSQALMIGDGRAYCTALVTLDETAL